MDLRHRSIQILGCLAIAVGCLLALSLIGGLATFGHIANFWMLLGHLLFAAVAVYLIYLGLRGLAFAHGKPLSKPRFGWGRILLGAVLLFSSANDHFHLLSSHTAIKRLEPSNPTQAVAMNITAIVIAVGCVIMIFSGIWIGVRRRQVVKT
jgi:hypothetical protein